MSREDVRINLTSWEADSERYQRENSPQLNRWDRLGWGVWDILEDDLHALGDVAGLDALELGCGACQFGIKVAMRGANVTGLDFSAQQLAHAEPNMAETGVRFPLVRASAEEIPFADEVFDLVFCDHGAPSFADPAAFVPEVARVLRPSGRFVFNRNTPFISIAWGDDDRPPGRELLRSYFDLGRTEWHDEDDVSVEYQLPYGEWIRLFLANGFEIEDLIELRAPADAATTYSTYADPSWAHDFPAEHIWKVRKASPR
jgi:SAM-dependent methyltransferase